VIVDAHVPFLEANQTVACGKLASQLFILALLTRRLAQVVTFDHCRQGQEIVKRKCSASGPKLDNKIKYT